MNERFFQAHFRMQTLFNTGHNNFNATYIDWSNVCARACVIAHVVVLLFSCIKAYSLLDFPPPPIISLNSGTIFENGLILRENHYILTIIDSEFLLIESSFGLHHFKNIIKKLALKSDEVELTDITSTSRASSSMLTSLQHLRGVFIRVEDAQPPRLSSQPVQSGNSYINSPHLPALSTTSSANPASCKLPPLFTEFSPHSLFYVDDLGLVLAS